MAAMEVGDDSVVHVPIQRLCRICLSPIDDLTLDLLNPGDCVKYSTSELLEYVKTYFGLSIFTNDGMSTKICAACIKKIDTWLADRKMVEKCKIVLEFLIRKRPNLNGMVTSSMETTNILEADTSKSQKSPVLCPFCNNYEKKEIIDKKHFCRKHRNASTCLSVACNLVFPNKETLIPHYRSHLRLKKTDFLCSKCLGLLDCARNVSYKKHEHQYTPKLFRCCGMQFPSMIDFVCHKLQVHSAIIITRNVCDPMFKNVQNQKPKRSKSIISQKIQTRRSVARAKNNNTVSTLKTPKINKVQNGKILCKVCQTGVSSVNEYISHAKIKHNNIYEEKAKGIRLCPLCDINYSNDRFNSHINECTNSMKVGDNYGCIFCTKIFSGISQCQFRYHFNFCKTFIRESNTNNDEKLMKCRNCTFESTSIEECLRHANTYCIYFKLKIKFAMKPGEKEEVLEKIKELDNIKNADWTKYELKNTTGKEICDLSRQRLLGNYNYLCNICGNKFFTFQIFRQHLISEGVTCRSSEIEYCNLCLSDFKSIEAYREHKGPIPPFEFLPPYDIPIKNEQNDFELNVSAEVYDEDYMVSMTSGNGIEFGDMKECIMSDININASTSHQGMVVSNLDINGSLMEESKNIDIKGAVASTSFGLHSIKVDEEEKPDLIMLCADADGECSSHSAN